MGPLGSQLAPKGNLPGNVNLLSLRFHNIITIIIYIIIIMIMKNNTDTDTDNDNQNVQLFVNSCEIFEQKPAVH